MSRVRSGLLASLASSAVALGALTVTPAVQAASAPVPTVSSPAAADVAKAKAKAKAKASVSPEVDAKAKTLGKSERLGVIATLEVAGVRPSKSAVKTARVAALKALPSKSYDVVTAYRQIPVVSLEVDRTGLDALREAPGVDSIQLDQVRTLTMTDANAVTGADEAHASGITGDGVTVAIIDTGVDSASGVVHPALADDLAGQRCFRTENDCINSADSAEDQDGHGTHVAGIITGPNGVAPDAQFYALKVFTTETTSDTNILNALDYVVGLNNATPGAVDVVNMSLGGDNFSNAEACNAANPAYRNVFATLNAQNTAIFVATGNDAETDSVGSPACVDGAIGVGSVGDATFTQSFGVCTDNGQADKVSCFSNTTPVQGDGELVDLLAPGCDIVSLGLNNSTSQSMCGTSMATPYAAGAAALVLEYANSASVSLAPSDLETLMEDTGEPVTDYRLTDGPTYPRVAPADSVGALAMGAPASLTVTGTTATSASLSWTGIAAAANYSVTRTAASGEVTTLTSTGTGTTFTDTSVGCGTTSYVVRAVDAGGTRSAPSNTVTATVRACPLTPTNLTLAKTSATSSTLSWAAAAGNDEVVIESRSPLGSWSEVTTLAAATTSYVHTQAGCGVVEFRLSGAAANGDRSAPTGVVQRAYCAPGNDDLADAKVIVPGAAGTSTTETEANAKYASTEASDPAFSCKYGGEGPGYDGLWYTITPTASASVTISTAASTLTDPTWGDPDTLIAVYSGTPSLANEIACNDDISTSNYRSTLTTNVEPGNTYYVHVAQWIDVASDATGSLVTGFSWSAPVVVPSNDLWVNATSIAAMPYSDTVTDAQNAGTSASDPAHPCAYSGSRVGTSTMWWTFTPQTAGTLDLDTLSSSGSFDDTLLSVWSGSPGGFVNVACNDDTPTATANYRSSLTDVTLDAGITYSIQVSRFSTTATTAAGTVVLKADFTSDPTVLVSTDTLQIEEGWGSASYTLSLATAPTNDVTVTIEAAGCEVSPSMVTFTATNYATPQTVTVTAGDDQLEEPTSTCTITHTVDTSDPDYDGISVPAVEVSVLDALTTSISLDSPAEGSVLVVGEDVTADFACSDNRGGAGVVSCVGEVADGAQIPTDTPGDFSFTVTLTDSHGVVTSLTHAYSVGIEVPESVAITDLRIKKGNKWVGNDIYNAKPAKQKVTKKAKVGKKASFVVSVQNDGDLAARTTVKGGKSGRGFTVNYFNAAGKKITKKVVKGKFRTPVLAAGATYQIKVVVTVTKKAKKSAMLKTKLRASTNYSTSVGTLTTADSGLLVTRRR